MTPTRPSCSCTASRPGATCTERWSRFSSATGFRVVAPDLVGFGRSDKPAERTDYTYERHVRLDAVGAHRPPRARGPDSRLPGLGRPHRPPPGRRRSGPVQAGGGCQHGAPHRRHRNLRSVPGLAALLPGGPGDADRSDRQRRDDDPTWPAEVIAAYDAPFPDETYKEGARQFPVLVPTRPDDPSSETNRRAWTALEQFERPFLCAFSDKDPITKGADRMFRELVPGCKDQKHVTIEGGGHFLQEDRGEQLADVVADFIRSTAAA